MATVGHFITMLGVIAFYIAIFEAHLEKKITAYLFSLIPRLNKRVCYYLSKLIHLHLQTRSLTFVPNKRTRLAIINNL